MSAPERDPAVEQLLAEAAADDTEQHHYFGYCPECGPLRYRDRCLNIGRAHWYYCEEHLVRWCVGANLFSGWRDETEEEQRAHYDALGFGFYRDLNDDDESEKWRA